MAHILKNKRSRRILFAVLLLLLLPILLIGGLWLLDPYGFRMAEGVSVGGVDISGMTWPDAKNRLEQELQQSAYTRALTLTLPQETLTVDPECSKAEVDLTQVLWTAYRYGRFSSQPEPALDLADYLTWDEAAVRTLLENYAATYDTSFRESDWQLEGAAPILSTDQFDPEAAPQTLVLNMGVPEARLDVEGALEQIFRMLADAAGVCASGDYSLCIEVVPTQVPELPDADAIFAEICTEPVSDSLDLETYSFVPGSYGCQISLADLRAQVEAAAPGQQIRIPMEFAAPEILGDQVYFRDVLGTCETRHNDNQNRNTNLRLLCEALDGYILQPGEEFSYNAVVGERTPERGYLPAPAYSGNRLVNSVGGGVCQGSTTLYNCVLLADLEVVFRACHGASVGYVPVGLDAAVNYLTTDFKFRNNWHFPIMLQAEVSDGYVKMKILGTDEKDYYIKMESGYGEDEVAVYARSYKCKYDKQTDELLSRDLEAFSTYYKSIK